METRSALNPHKNPPEQPPLRPRGHHEEHLAPLRVSVRQQEKRSSEAGVESTELLPRSARAGAESKLVQNAGGFSDW